MEFLPSPFNALQRFPQFIIYLLSSSKTRLGKMDKFPVDYRTGHIISKGSKQSHWTTFDKASAALKLLGNNYGIGFVFTKNDPFFFLDIDNCLQADGQWSPLANQLATIFSGAAIEISSSGQGLHIIGTGNAPPHTCNPTEHNLEFYTCNRFVALTGTGALGSADFNCEDKLSWLVNTYFSPRIATTEIGDWTDEPNPAWIGPLNDDDLINRALRSQSSRSVFGNSASFKDLWEANYSVLESAYNNNESSYDAALAQHLVFWTGGNCERIKQLMLRSNLVREKWEREDYLPRTILSACANATDYLHDKPQPLLDSSGVITASLVNTNMFLTPAQQLELFNGCVYVRDEHRVLIPGGDLLKPEQFRATFGGFAFVMDIENQRTSRNAWEAFSESQAIKKVVVDSTCFLPNLPPGQVIEKEGRRLANVWWPIHTKKTEGDPTLFILHLHKLLNNEKDELILLSYMAACVQHVGVKFQWAPLIQGVEGNGKTLLSLCVARAIGKRYSHFPKASQLTEKYNDWMYKTLFVGVEDIYVPDEAKEIMEELKPMITREEYEIRAMHTNKIMRDICCNFILNTNHKDGLRKTKNDRRFAPFYTAQQTADDLIRDGMTGEYFTNLYTWLEHKDGYAIVSHYLSNYKIPPELNPVNKKPAPITSSTDAAIISGMGGVEQEILEAIAQGYSGFRGGWISSNAFDALLEKLNMTRRIPRSKRRDLLVSLGYDLHPHLTDGRVNNIVMPDVAKPRLYILHLHPAREITSPAEIARAYTEAQK